MPVRKIRRSLTKSVVHRHDARSGVSAVREAADIGGIEKAAALIAVQRLEATAPVEQGPSEVVGNRRHDHPFPMADPTLSVADSSAHGPKEARARDQSPLPGAPQMTDRPAIRDHLLAATPLSRAEPGCGGKLPRLRASAS